MNICSTLLKLKKSLTYVTLTEFWKLNTTSNISAETSDLRIWMTLKEMRQVSIFGEQEFQNVLQKFDMLQILQWIQWMSNTKEKAPINWHYTCQLTRLYENFKEQYFRIIQSTSWQFERVWFLWRKWYGRESDWLG